MARNSKKIDDCSSSYDGVCLISNSVGGGNWVGCDMCGGWLHGQCIGVTSAQYKVFKLIPANFKYHCDKCMPGSSTQSANAMFQKLMTKIDSIGKSVNQSNVKSYAEAASIKSLKINEVSQSVPKRYDNSQSKFTVVVNNLTKQESTSSNILFFKQLCI